MKTIQFARGELFLSQIFVNRSSAFVEKRQVSLQRGKASELAEATLHAMRTTQDVDVSKSLAIELTRNQERINEVLAEIRRATDPSQISYFNGWLSELIAYGEDVQRYFVPETEVLEGALHVVVSRNQNGDPSYVLMFSPYFGAGGAMKPVVADNAAKLREFLRHGIGVTDEKIELSLGELSRQPTSTLPNVLVSKERLTNLGLL